MDQTADAFAAALSSGDTDRVNRAIDSVDDMELEERAALFDDCFERCRDLYASDNGYQRQSVVRFAAALYPGLAFRTVGADRTDAVLPDDWTLDEIATHRHRLREFYLDALVDDDGRVRRAAAKGLKELAVAAELIGAEDELQTMLAELETLAENHNDESVQKHINQARENVAFHAQKPGSLLPEGLRDVFE
ncbi:hypothetical protein [Halobellus clavatus]|uniref:HEAT repeat-containing protein n=1 Tax=Halobellus clavatus TaxID=660517 RepID=A0A1H3KL32_9EURY|nr:hypothetical protein [Halobellus clavatus]SDY52892.1 hypothetical protein SAMN04487946_12033 [Halobellus clavatus]